MEPVVNATEVRDGMRLQYVEQGDPSGVPVLLLHGLTDSWRSFERVLPHLPPSIRAFALTQRGHGDSDRPHTGYRTRDFAADAAAFADAAGLGPAIVVGHSMGSANALRFAIDFPDRTLGVVLGGPGASYSRNPGLVEFGESAIAGLTDPIDRAFVREFQEGTLARPVPEAFLAAMIAESLKVPARVWRAAFEGLMEDDFVRELELVKAPTLIVWGDRDGLIPRADQDALVAGISGSRLVVYEGTGHGLHWEEPERFAADLATFAHECASGAR
jgi:non-heme chloroperoxidase